jgi:hypothetical protein
MTYDVDLIFNEVEKHEFERLAQCIAEPMKESAYKEVLSKYRKGHQFVQNPRCEQKPKRGQNQKRGQKPRHRQSSLSAVANSLTEGPLELTEALSHKALSATVFVPISNKLELSTSSLKLETFQNTVSIHLWHLATVNLADDGAKEKDCHCLMYTAVRGGAMRHAYS